MLHYSPFPINPPLEGYGNGKCLRPLQNAVYHPAASIFSSQEKSEAMIIIVFLFFLPSKPNCKGCITCVKDLEQSPREKAIGIAATEAN